MGKRTGGAGSLIDTFVKGSLPTFVRSRFHDNAQARRIMRSPWKYAAAASASMKRMEKDISAVAALMGDPTRAHMLLALMGGIALPAGELALRANVAPQTASAHLAKLVEGR